MEFYPKLSKVSFLKATCFNSQRDGILRSSLFNIVRAGNVSIPNGMEFYSNSIFLWNSLRLVSIPNGMEFYKTCITAVEMNAIVSIPNGMEFYFNRYESSSDLLVFQFPTGWNSTRSFQNQTFWKRGFNSQRDGILQKRKPKVNRTQSRFNSQRDGILQ